jgi:hypothetical protein
MSIPRHFKYRYITFLPHQEIMKSVDIELKGWQDSRTILHVRFLSFKTLVLKGPNVVMLERYISNPGKKRMSQTEMFAH